MIPVGCDVRLGIDQDSLSILDDPWKPLVRVPYGWLITAVAQPSEATAGPWFGLPSGGFMVFSQPMVSAGLWVLTYSDGAGGIEQAALGARDGLFQSKPTRGGLQTINLLLEDVAASAVADAEEQFARSNTPGD